MSLLQQQLEDTANWIAGQFSSYEQYDEGHAFPWPNHMWRGDNFRRAHLDVVDARETHKLYMLHLTVFPNTNDPSPVFGFDVISGPKKVTGLFHDYSPISSDTALDRWFGLRVGKTEWSKQRDLPEWAQAIFSKHMVAAGNIQEPDELASLLALVKDSLQVYLANVGVKTEEDFTAQQNNYCVNQKRNPHTPRVMQALGFEQEVVHEFIHLCLFPELHGNA